MNKDIIIGVDAGTSLIKAVAFTLDGKELAVSSKLNTYKTSSDGGATQSLDITWKNCVNVIKDLHNKIHSLKERVISISITGQGDGTWLIDKEGNPVCDAWLWLDSRSSQIAKKLSESDTEDQRFFSTGTGIFAGQQSSQILYMENKYSDLLNKSETAFHCKDWLYFKLTGTIATDPSEACFTFGDFRTKKYNNEVINNLGLQKRKSLFPEIIDGSKHSHSLNNVAATQLDLYSGTPVSLAYIDAVCTFLGSGGYNVNKNLGSSIIGTTCGHMKASLISNISPNMKLKSGYIMLLPIEKFALQFQTNMSGTLNLDWLRFLVEDIFLDFNIKLNENDFMKKIDTWVSQAKPGKLVYHPFISEAGERGPFINSKARASILGLRSNNRFPEIVRSFVEGLCFAAKECYSAMGDTPSEIILSGGGSKSEMLLRIFSSVLKIPVRTTSTREAGACGAAMIGAMSQEIYNDWNDCLIEWTEPNLGQLLNYDQSLSEIYDNIYRLYLNTKSNIEDNWEDMK